MAMTFQLTFDCADPDLLASFWARALGYRSADPPEGFATWEAWLEALGIPEDEWGSGSTISDPGGVRPSICFLQVPEPKTSKNRLHLDLDASAGTTAPLAQRTEEVDAEVTRLLELGATKLRVYAEQAHYHVVMADPEGNEFCVR